VELQIKTAEELVDPDLEARWVARREARLTDVLQAILRAFRDRGGPVPVEEISVALPERTPGIVRETLVALDKEDLIQLAEGRVEIAYPFSAAPTPFIARFTDGQSDMRAARLTRSESPRCWLSRSTSSRSATTARRTWRWR
jgi:hypothetical protein